MGLSVQFGVNTFREVPIVNDKDALIMKNFINLKSKSGLNARAQLVGVTFEFFKFVGKKDIVDIDEYDFLAYMADMDLRNLAYSTKVMRRARLNTFFNFYGRRMAKKRIPFFNPVPPLDECNIIGDSILSAKEQQDKIKEETFELDDLLKILKESKLQREKYFIANLLLTFCGMRIRECLTIRLENINTQERWLMTGIDEVAKKNNKKGNNPLYFIFPEKVAIILEQYIIELKERNPENIWLFDGKNKHITNSAYYSFMKKVGIAFNSDNKDTTKIKKSTTKSHKFRKTLAKFWVDYNEVLLHITEMLSNHQITSVVMRYYAKSTIEDRRKFYDQYLPKEFKKLLIFLKTL